MLLINVSINNHVGSWNPSLPLFKHFCLITKDELKQIMVKSKKINANQIK